MGTDARQDNCTSLSLSTSFTMAEDSVDCAYVGAIGSYQITHSGTVWMVKASPEQPFY